MPTQTGSLDLKASKAAHTEASQTATNYITYIDSTNGIRVYDGNSSNQNVNFAQINSSGMQVYKGGTASSNKVAEFGETVTVGKNVDGKTRTVIDSTGMQILRKNGTTDVQIAKLGYDNGYSGTGTATADAPYFTFGTRSTAQIVIDGETYDNRLGNNSFAHGTDNIARGANSHAEGARTIAMSFAAHAEGADTIAYGLSTHAEGRNTIAVMLGSHAEGLGTKTADANQHVQGKYNDPKFGDAFQIGNGGGDDSRSNAFTVDWDGNVEAAGEITGATTKTTITTFSSGWALYDSLAGSVVTLRRNGKIVTLTGALKNTSSITLDATESTVFTIPSGYRPSQGIVTLAQGSTTNIFCLRVYSSGGVTFGRYRNSTSYSSIAAGAWFPFHVTWIMD